MTWYSKYLSVFEKPFDAVPFNLFLEVRQSLQKFQNPNPIASIVIIAHNEEKRLLSCLWSLSDNICTYPVEIIGINNNSTDMTSDVYNAAGVTWYMEEKKSPGYARKCGLDHARGKYYICIDADTMYPPYYIQTMIKELEKQGIAGVYSLWSFLPSERSSRFSLKVYEIFRDLNIMVLSFNRPELNVRGMTFGYPTQLGKEVGFRLNIRRGEDGAMALGLKKYGKIKLVTTRKARAITSPGTLNSEGSLLRNLRIKIIRHLKSAGRYFTKRKEYIDRDYNLITPPHEDPK